MCLQIGMIFCNVIIEFTMIYELLVGMAFVVAFKNVGYNFIIC
jgi:hypothetical protein